MPKKLTIEEMHELAANQGGFCLSREYLGCETKLLWQCKNGHKWESSPNNIKAKHWCPYCAGKMPSTIEEMKGVAALHGGECLSTIYKSQESKLLWRCKERHEWWAIPKHIMKGVVWCPYCANKIRGDKNRENIEDMQKLASKHAGFCLSRIDITGPSKFLWQCKNGHEWKTTAARMKQRVGFCARCDGYEPTLDDLQNIAKSKGGKCLSSNYINSSKKLQWRCKEGHEWKASLSMIKSGHWCPYCANHFKLTIKEMQELAAKRGGLCLSNKYINNSTKLKWKCKEGHTFEASPSHIKTSKSWCPKCGYKVVSEKGRYSMEEIRKMAIKKGGECLSKEYNISGEKLLWRCNEGHEWKTSPHNIKNNTAWCPNCNSYINEELVRAIFEKIFEVKFIKGRPRWLIGSSGRTLELDGYNKDLGIAFEYHGEQHFNGDNYFYRSNIKTNIEKRMLDDSIKRRTCLEKGINLIEIPFNIQQKDYFTYINEQCKNKGIEIDPNKHVNYRDLHIFTKSKLQEMKDFAALKGGDCISTGYLGNANKLSWKCKHGHVWEATPQCMKKRLHWCVYCNPAKNTPLTIEEMQNIAINKGGQCLSKEYINSDKKLKWSCKNKHEWMVTPHDIKNGNWCPHCSKRAKLTIEEMRDMANKHEGFCFSDKYINSVTKLKWCCKNGHEWGATPTSIKSGRWCLHCSGRAKITIEEMQNIAHKRSGQCLSKEYQGIFKKHEWQCKNGHRWEATPQSIRRGSWCPKCINRKVRLKKYYTPINSNQQSLFGY